MQYLMTGINTGQHRRHSSPPKSSDCLPTPRGRCTCKPNCFERAHVIDNIAHNEKRWRDRCSRGQPFTKYNASTDQRALVFLMKADVFRDNLKTEAGVGLGPKQLNLAPLSRAPALLALGTKLHLIFHQDSYPNPGPGPLNI